MLEEIRAEAKNVLHIGNDAKADIQQSKAVGLDAYLIKPPSRKSYVNESKAKSDLDYSLLYGFIKKHNSLKRLIPWRIAWDSMCLVLLLRALWNGLRHIRITIILMLFYS